MSYTYADRKRTDPSVPQNDTSSAQPSLDALRSGASAPTSEQMGRRIDLPDVMREKMENAFGADLSAVKLYESQAVADAGAKAVTKGSDIAFAPGLADFSAYSGQALLGHEMSHVVSQARGEVTGRGYLDNSALEARADREGAMAASGQQIAMPTASLSPVTAAAADGPMQAARDKKEKKNGAWDFTSKADDKEQMPTGGIGFVLGMSNASDPNHGDEFKEMMTELNALAAIKGNRRHVGDAAYDAMIGNTYQNAITKMQAYRAKLKSEKRGNSGDRKRQISFLDDVIKRTKADAARNERRKQTVLPGSEFAGDIRGGAINRVYRYSREGEGAYFKPPAERDPNEVNSKMDDSMEDAGITDDPSDRQHLHLSKREVAFSRLGSLLGSEVAVGAKMATLGEETPEGQIFNNAKFLHGGGTQGALLDEAKGKSWDQYNWSFYGITPPAAAGNAGAAGQAPTDPIKEVMAATPAATPDGRGSTPLGSRLDAGNFGLSRVNTTDHSFDPVRTEVLKEGAPVLDIADPDYQRQMNEMFLIDTLAGHMDRHQENFKVNRGDDGKISVRAIDNDMTFGSRGDAQDRAHFGKASLYTPYSGLPTQMQIDANMAKKIHQTTPEMLKKTFGDLLKQEEIDSLWTRFQMMQAYIDSMRNTDSSLIVDQWNDQTAQRELRLAGGTNAVNLTNSRQAGGYSGNNYYQRQALMLNMYGGPERRHMVKTV